MSEYADRLEAVCVEQETYLVDIKGAVDPESYLKLVQEDMVDPFIVTIADSKKIKGGYYINLTAPNQAMGIFANGGIILFTEKGLDAAKEVACAIIAGARQRQPNDNVSSQ